MVRELAGHDYDAAQRILDWPLREAFHGYLNYLKRTALEEWRWARLEWASLKPTTRGGKLSKPPARPPILRDGDE